VSPLAASAHHKRTSVGVNSKSKALDGDTSTAIWPPPPQTGAEGDLRRSALAAGDEGEGELPFGEAKREHAAGNCAGERAACGANNGCVNRSVREEKAPPPARNVNKRLVFPVKSNSGGGGAQPADPRLQPRIRRRHRRDLRGEILRASDAKIQKMAGTASLTPPSANSVKKPPQLSFLTSRMRSSSA
jgi:hypothetical protein